MLNNNKNNNNNNNNNNNQTHKCFKKPQTLRNENMLHARTHCVIFQQSYINILLPSGSEEREVLGVGSIPAAILPSCQYMKNITG